MPKIRLVFAGSDAFAIPFLEFLLQKNSIAVVAVLTRPDKPAGRGHKMAPNPLKAFAIAKGLSILQPEKLALAAFEKQWLLEQALDCFVVVAFGAMVPKGWLALSRWGWINVHPSWLPRWRGAAPMARTLLAGDQVSALTIMQMDTGWDSGSLYHQQPILLSETETTESLSKRFQAMGPNCLGEVLDAYQSARPPSLMPQPAFSTCYAAKLTKEEALLDWNLPAPLLVRKIRGYCPWPMAWSWLGQKRFQFLEADHAANVEASHGSAAGRIWRCTRTKTLFVQSGQDHVVLKKGQLEGQPPRSGESLYQMLQTYVENGSDFRTTR